jgi:hypothetical protein
LPFYLADRLYMNESEARELLGAQSPTSARSLPRAVSKATETSWVCVTFGREGCGVYDDGTHAELNVNATPAIDPTGAGDAFLAAMEYSLANGIALDTALAAATTAATERAGKRGASIPWARDTTSMDTPPPARDHSPQRRLQQHGVLGDIQDGFSDANHLALWERSGGKENLGLPRNRPQAFVGRMTHYATWCENGVLAYEPTTGRAVVAVYHRSYLGNRQAWNDFVARPEIIEVPAVADTFDLGQTLSDMTLPSPEHLL